MAEIDAAIEELTRGKRLGEAAVVRAGALAARGDVDGACLDGAAVARARAARPSLVEDSDESAPQGLAHPRAVSQPDGIARGASGANAALRAAGRLASEGRLRVECRLRRSSLRSRRGATPPVGRPSARSAAFRPGGPASAGGRLAEGRLRREGPLRSRGTCRLRPRFFAREAAHSARRAALGAQRRLPPEVAYRAQRGLTRKG